MHIFLAKLRKKLDLHLHFVYMWIMNNVNANMNIINNNE